MELKKYSDTKLIELISKNNILALEELFNRYSKVLFTLILKICSEQVHAEKILQQVFVTIFNKAKFFPFDTDNSYAWIIMLARNRAVDSMRRNRTAEQIDIHYDDDFENKYVLPTLSNKVDALDFETAVRISEDIYSAYFKLTDMQRIVIELAFYDGFAVNEIAANLKLPVETIRSKIMYSIFSLRDKLLQDDSKDISENTLIYEFISAYTLGCLERKNHDMFLDYYHAGKLKESEINTLGVIQNVVTLIPLSLNPVNPPDNLFENIKLLLISSGVKITENIEEETDESKIQIKNEEENKSEEKFSTNSLDDLNNETNLPDDKPESKKEDKQVITINESVTTNNIKFNGYVKGLTKKQRIIFFGSISASIILLIFLVVVSSNSSATINDLENRLEIAEEKASKSFDFMKDYQTYIDFTNQGNFKVIQLKDTSGFVAARLFLSLKSDEGLLQIDNLPKIQSDEEYSLQSVKSGVSNRLMTFIISGNGKYLWVNGKSNAQLLASDLFKIVIHKKNKKQTEGTPLFWGN